MKICLPLAFAAIASAALPAAAAVRRIAPPATIQSAVDAASPGDTIRIAAGTYVEQVIVRKDLTLDAEPGATLRAPGTKLLAFDGGVAMQAGIITVLSANVDVRGLTIDGNLAATPEYWLNGVLFLQAGGSVTGCHILNVAAPGWPALTDRISAFGVTAGNTVATRYLTISDNLIERFNDYAITVTGNGDDFAPIVTIADVERNVIRGAGPQPVIGQFGILVFRGATGTIRGNYIDEMGTTNFFGSEGGVGIHARFADGVVIEDNELIHIQNAIRCHDTQTAKVIGNHIVGNPSGADLNGTGIFCGGPGAHVINANRIENLMYSSDPNDRRIGIFAFGSDATIQGNHVEVLSPTGVVLDGPNGILWLGDRGNIAGNVVHMPLRTDPSVIFLEPVALVAVGNGNQISGNSLYGQSTTPASFGIAIAGDGARVVGNLLADLPLGILSVNDPADGLVTTGATIQGNRFVDVGTATSP